MVPKKKRKPLSIVSKSAARIAAVQIIYNILASTKPIEQVSNEYFVSFKKDLENQFDIVSLDVDYLELILTNFDHGYEKIIEVYFSIFIFLFSLFIFLFSFKANLGFFIILESLNDFPLYLLDMIT